MLNWSSHNFISLLGTGTKCRLALTYNFKRHDKVFSDKVTNYTPLQGRVRQQKSDTYLPKGAVVETPNLSFEIAPPYRFWENRDVILHVKSMGKIACVGTITEFELKICHWCELSSYCYLNGYQWGLRYTLTIWRQSRLTSHFRNQIKRFGVCLEASCSWLSK